MTFLTASLALPTASCAGHPFDLIGSAAHDWSPDELMAARSPALYLINATIRVRVALKMISVEKFFDENLSRMLLTYPKRADGYFEQ